MRIALIGSNGQLAHDLDVVLKECGHEVLGLSHSKSRWQILAPCGLRCRYWSLTSS